MSVAVISGSAGLVGSECAHLRVAGLDVVGVDNDMRGVIFGPEASTTGIETRRSALGKWITTTRTRHPGPRLYVEALRTLRRQIELVIHAAAQPSHDWAAREPFTDFDINAVGTLNLLEATRLYAPDSTFIFTSTNKVYGDLPNHLPLVERETRWEIDPGTDTRRDRRGHADRQVATQPVRGVEGRSRRTRSGVRPLLRDGHRLLPRRYVDRPTPFGHRVARLSRVRHALHDDPNAVHGLRLQGQAGP